jgi:uncharacterized protein (TIGR00290 family)
MGRPRLLLSWSSGKDSAWALHVLRKRGEYEVAGLFTTFNAEFDRVAMHGVRRDLTQAQARAARLPLHWIALPHPCSNAEYERIMGQFVESARAAGVSYIAFGDLFLADIRAYREKKLAGSGITPVFPLWGSDTSALSNEMMAAGLRAVLTTVDPTRLPREFAGQTFDDLLLHRLPEGVDPCGENGEFHTFCCAGPMFDRPIALRSGEIVERDGFVFADFQLDEGARACA